MSLLGSKTLRPEERSRDLWDDRAGRALVYGATFDSFAARIVVVVHYTLQGFDVAGERKGRGISCAMITRGEA